MDFTQNKACIISCGVGGWYGTGVQRLHSSLVFHGYAGGLLLYKDILPPDSPTHIVNPYAFKIYAFMDAISKGYTHILWLDSSFWAIKNPHHLFDIMADKGVLAFRSGYNCAQTCPDNLLSRMGYTRDEAEALPEIATGMVGLNISNPDGKSLFDLWAQLCFEGYFINSRSHNIQESSDPRFLHGRQDQSAFSIASHKLGLHIDHSDYVAYYGTSHDKEKCMFFIGGL